MIFTTCEGSGICEEELGIMIDILDIVCIKH